MLILTTGDGVDGFTLDRDIGAFVLTHPRLMIPGDCAEFAINASNERFWEPPVHRYIQECLAGSAGPRGRDFSRRWIASLVAETFRILTRGGVFLPVSARQQGNRYGGAAPAAARVQSDRLHRGTGRRRASTGRERVLEIQPASLHQRAPLTLGSRNEVERIER